MSKNKKKLQNKIFNQEARIRNLEINGIKTYVELSQWQREVETLSELEQEYSEKFGNRHK